MPQQSTKPFQAATLTNLQKNFEYLGESIDWLRAQKKNGAIYERDHHGDWQARYAIKNGEIISLRGLTGMQSHEAIFNA